MALFIRQEESKSELSRKIAAELKERAKISAKARELDDQSKNANMLKNQHQTSPLAFIIAAVVAVVLIVVLYLAIT